MNADHLAKAAALSTAPYIASLNAALLHKLELAFVAEWLDSQDPSIHARALPTALAAIAALRAVFARNQ